MRKKPNNPRQISRREYARLQADLERFGDLGGIVHNAVTDNIVGGNQRASVFDLVGKGAEIVIVEEYDPPTRTGTAARGYVLWNGEKYDYRCVVWDTETEDAACITANLRGGSWDWQEMAGWDTSALIERGLDTEALVTWNADAAELNAMLTAEKDAPPDDPGAQTDRAEELQEKWCVEVGQLWQLGEHRVICGDCTVAAVVARVMDGEKAGAVVTDPPYGLGDTKSFNNNHPDYNDAKPFDLTLLDLSVPFVIWGGNYYDQLPIERNKIGWIVWDKRPDLEGEKRERADRIFGQHFEIAITNIGCLRGKMYRQRWGGFYGSQEIFHKTQKPPELFEWCIAPTGGVVADFFLGSGTTLIACERLGRKCRGVEISPAYIAVTIQRWVDMTGGEPILLTQ